ncbi:MAG TPA: glycosyltransferase [Candidatus Limnocylindrales bacterium]|nr:glycosyltransferase [Candidatus Limnocylindrales bacterium]
MIGSSDVNIRHSIKTSKHKTLTNMRYDNNYMLLLWLTTFILEALIFAMPTMWQMRRPLAAINSSLLAISVFILCLRLDILPTTVLVLLSLYRIGNMGRLLKGRMNEQYLHLAVKRTSFWLFIMHAVFLTVIILPFSLMPYGALRILLVVQAALALASVLITLKNILKLRFSMPTTFLTDRELPTVTVAIPARNETDELQNCLRSVLANDYPKLEVVVLDDCSQSQTAEIIKSFAHDGVRFVRGDKPAERWLAKNQAYQKLYQESAGELILFCGVDVRFGSTAIRSMVNLLQAREKSMLSVLPVRFMGSPMTALIQPIRYWWELSLPRRLFNRPAVLSTCWIIGREDLARHGGFTAVSHSILPEAFFARELIKSDQYSFVRSSAELEVQTTKNFHEQYTTAIRSRYPQLHKRPEWILLLTTFNVVAMLLPFGLLILHHWWPLTGLGLPLLTICLWTIGHVLIVSSTDPSNALLALLTFPIAVVTEVIVSYISMVQYEFFTVEWKDRNICIPVMHVIPHLPKMQ